METQFVFRSEYRLDLNPVDSVLIPYLFAEDESKLIINLKARPTRNYRSAGRIEQILWDLPNKPVANSQTLRFGDQFFEFSQPGKFKLRFFPNFFLGRTTFLIHKVLSANAD